MREPAAAHRAPDVSTGSAVAHDRITHVGLIGVALLLLMTSACADGGDAAAGDRMVIQEQGSFLVGGTVIANPGTFDPYNPTPAGQTFRGDHAGVGLYGSNNPTPRYRSMITRSSVMDTTGVARS